MFFARLVPQKFSSRLFLVTFMAGLVPIIIFTILIGTYGRHIEKEITRIIEEGYEQDMLHSEVMLQEMGEASVYGRITEIARQLDMVIESVPWMTLSDLRRDANFRDLAVEAIGQTGHTFVFESRTAVVAFHRDRRLEQRDLRVVYQDMPEFQAILARSMEGSGTARGYYGLKAGDGHIMRRFIYILPLQRRTADGVRLSVAATVNMEDFSIRIREAEANHNATKRFLVGASGAAMNAFRRTALLSMGLAMAALSLMAFVMGISLSRAVTRLREATRRVNEGDLSTPVEVRGSGEVATFMGDFNRMVDRLAATTVSKELLQASEVRLREANNELLKEIAERERTEEALAEEKERLSITLRSIGDGVITADSGGKIVLINRAAEKLTGWQQDQAMGTALSQVFRVTGDASPSPGGDGGSSEREAEGPKSPLSQRVLLARDGTERVISETRSLIGDKGGSVLGTVIVFRDVSLEKRMEEEVLKAQKLESLGILAGGIAHDFNNLLAVVLGNISFAKMLLKHNEKVSDRLAEAEKACLRGKDLTYQLLAFARGGEPLHRVAAAARLIEDSARSCLDGPGVTLSCAFPDDLPPLKIDEEQIRQVIQKMVNNAIEAMDSRGTLTMGAEVVFIGPGNPLALVQGKYVRIFLQDDGPGIAEQDLPRIFDPYFTKKQMGSRKGTGLGLSICYSIVRDHGGLITVESAPGKGSLFHVYLPVVEEGPQLSEPAFAEEGAGRKGKLLFMDDDQGVRDVIVEILAHLGYTVRFARDGLEAIEQYEEAARGHEPFDVVIADLTVPDGMGGKELVEQLRTIDPEVKAIISSGYSTDPVLHDFKKHGFAGVVAKPYKVEELCAVLDTVIQAGGTGQAEAGESAPG